MARDIPGGFEHRRSEIERVNNQTAQWFHCTGEIQVFGSGAATVDVLFPTYFVEKPRPSFGAELAGGEALVEGNMPTCSVVVIEWDNRRRDDGSVVYAGATLCVVTGGPVDQSMIAHWNFEGLALVSPSEDEDD